MLPKRLPAYRTALVLAFAALGLGAALYLFVAQRPVEISVDVLPAMEGGLRAVWSGGEARLEPLEERFAPHHVSVELTALPAPEDSFDSGFQVIAMLPPDFVSYTPLDAWVAVHTYFFLHGSERPASLRLSGWGIGPRAYLAFETDPVSGVVQVRSGRGEPETVSLQSPERGRRMVELSPDAPLRRFHGWVPRSALPTLRFAGDGPGVEMVQRVVLNSLLPTTFVVPNGPARAPVGRVVRDWDPAVSGGEVALPDAFYAGASLVRTGAILFCVTMTILLIGWLGLRRAARRWKASVPAVDLLGGRYPWKRLGALWGGTFLVWFIFLVSFYPGTLNVDSLSQWEQSGSFQFEPQHPPFYAWLMWLARHVLDSPFSVAFPQVVLGSGLVAFAANLLWHAGVPRGIVLGMYAVATLSPRNMTTMIALIKDAPYGICVFAACLCLAWIVMRAGKERWWPWVLMGLAFGMATLFRHNGPLMFAGTLPFLILGFHRQWRRIALCVGVAVAVVLGARIAVLQRIPIATTDGGLHDLMASHVAILLDRDVPMTAGEYGLLAQVRDLSDRWGYDERRVAVTAEPFLEDIYHRAWAKEHQAEFRRLYFSLICRNPLTAARYFWDRSAFMVIPWTTDVPMETYFLGITSNALGLSGTQIFLELPGQLESLLAWTARDSVQWFFWRPALPLYLILIAGVVLCYRQRNLRWAIIYLPLLVNTGAIALAAISQAARYQYPLTMASAFLIALAFLPRQAYGGGAQEP